MYLVCHVYVGIWQYEAECSFPSLLPPSLVQLARRRLEAIFFQSAYFFEKSDYLNSNRSFPDILIDLSKYQSDKLVVGSLHLLNRFYSAEVTLFEKAIQTQLLVTDESRRVFAEIGEWLPRLRHHLSVDVGKTEMGEIICILVKFSHMCSLQQDEQQAHKQNQNILYNYGELCVVSHVLLDIAIILVCLDIGISCQFLHVLWMW